MTDKATLERVARDIAAGEGWDGTVSESAERDTKPGPMTKVRWAGFLEAARAHIGDNRIMKRAPH